MSGTEIENAVVLELSPTQLAVQLEKLRAGKRGFGKVHWILISLSPFFAMFILSALAPETAENVRDFMRDPPWEIPNTLLSKFLFCVAFLGGAFLLMVRNGRRHDRSANPRSLDLLSALQKHLEPELAPQQPLRLELKQRPQFIRFDGPWLRLDLTLRDGTQVQIKASTKFREQFKGHKFIYKGSETFVFRFKSPAQGRYRQSDTQAELNTPCESMTLHELSILPESATFVWTTPRVKHVRHFKRGILVDARESLACDDALLRLLMSSWYLLKNSQKNVGDGANQIEGSEARYPQLRAVGS